MTTIRTLCLRLALDESDRWRGPSDAMANAEAWEHELTRLARTTKVRTATLAEAVADLPRGSRKIDKLPKLARWLAAERQERPQAYTMSFNWTLRGKS